MIIVDTGPIFAFLNEKDRYHSWAVKQFNELPTPFVTCDGVIIEAAYLSEKDNGIPDIFDLIINEAVVVSFSIQQESELLRDLIVKYEDVPMDIVDACIVRMSELFPEAKVLTVDSDFHVYRRNRNEPIPLIMPDS